MLAFKQAPLRLSTPQRAKSVHGCSTHTWLTAGQQSPSFSNVKDHHLRCLRLVDTDPDHVQARLQGLQMVGEHNLVPERFARRPQLTLLVWSALHTTLALGLVSCLHALPY